MGVGAESPEQIYGVDIDRIGVFISQMVGLVGITKYKFGGVYTDCVGIECVKGSNNGKYIYCEDGEKREVAIESKGS